jgi:hypothetical protein
MSIKAVFFDRFRVYVDPVDRKVMRVLIQAVGRPARADGPAK